MGTEKISMKKISEEAGVSVATVSRVINQNGRFSKETEEKVLRVIKKYDYRPNLLAKGLRTKNSKSIGVIVPDITNEFFARIFRELETRLFQKGYTVILCNSGEDPHIEDIYYQHLLTKGVVGVIYLSGKNDRRAIDSPIPVVYIGRALNFETRCVFIESDSIQGGYLATKELLDNQCKRILLVRDKRIITPPEHRQKGYEKALIEANIKVDPQLIVKADVGYESGKEAIKKAVNCNLRFDGVFATTDWLALGVIDGLRELSYRIPEDIKVIGFDNISISRFSYLPFSTIHQDIPKISEAAVNVMLKLIKDQEVPDKHIVIPVKLIKRESV